MKLLQGNCRVERTLRLGSVLEVLHESVVECCCWFVDRPCRGEKCTPVSRCSPVAPAINAERSPKRSILAYELKWRKHKKRRAVFCAFLVVTIVPKVGANIWGESFCVVTKNTPVNVRCRARPLRRKYGTYLLVLVLLVLVLAATQVAVFSEHGDLCCS